MNVKTSPALALFALLLVFSCGRPPSPGTSAQVVKVTGKVELTREYQTIIPCVSMILSTNDIIKTWENSSIDLYFPDTGLIRIFQSSAVGVGSLSRGPARETLLDLLSGRILCVLKKLAKDVSFRVTAGDAVIGVRGTTFYVEKTSRVRVAVLNGRVGLNNRTRQGPSVEIPQAYEAVFEASNFGSPAVTLTGKAGYTNMMREVGEINLTSLSDPAMLKEEVEAVRKNAAKAIADFDRPAAVKNKKNRVKKTPVAAKTNSAAAPVRW